MTVHGGLDEGPEQPLAEANVLVGTLERDSGGSKVLASAMEPAGLAAGAAPEAAGGADAGGRAQNGGGAKQRRRRVGKKRLFVVLSMTIGFLCGVPVWWLTTEVHRAALPHASIAATAARAAASPSSRLSLPRHVHVIIVGSSTADVVSLKGTRVGGGSSEGTRRRSSIEVPHDPGWRDGGAVGDAGRRGEGGETEPSTVVEDDLPLGSDGRCGDGGDKGARRDGCSRSHPRAAGGGRGGAEEALRGVSMTDDLSTSADELRQERGGRGCQKEAYAKRMEKRRDLDVIATRVRSRILTKLGEKRGRRGGKWKEESEIRLTVGFDGISGCDRSKLFVIGNPSEAAGVATDAADVDEEPGGKEGSRRPPPTEDGEGSMMTWRCGLAPSAFSPGAWDAWSRLNDTQFDDWLERYRRGGHVSAEVGVKEEEEGRPRQQRRGQKDGAAAAEDNELTQKTCLQEQDEWRTREAGGVSFAESKQSLGGGGHYTVVVLLEPKGRLAGRKKRPKNSTENKKKTPSSRGMSRSRSDAESENAPVERKGTVEVGSGCGRSAPPGAEDGGRTERTKGRRRRRREPKWDLSSSATVGKYRHGWVVLRMGDSAATPPEPHPPMSPGSTAEDNNHHDEDNHREEEEDEEEEEEEEEDVGERASEDLSLDELWDGGLKGDDSAAVDLISDVCLKLVGASETKEVGSNLPLAADGTAILSFSLINAEPSDWVYDWSFHAAEAEFLRPVLGALSPVMELKVESQVLYYGRKTAISTRDHHHHSQAHIVPFHQLPFFINSEDWILDSSVGAVGRSKLLHFVVYVPAADECPLRLQAPNGELSATNGFTVPSWGGVVVWNPCPCPCLEERGSTCTNRSDNMTKNSGDRRLRNTEYTSGALSCGEGGSSSLHRLSQREMRTIMGVVVAQLRWLFGLRTAPFPMMAGEGNRRAERAGSSSSAAAAAASSDLRSRKNDDDRDRQKLGLALVPASRTGFAEWEIDMLLRGRAAEDAAGAMSMLAALMKLIRDIPKMVVPDIIGQEVQTAISSVDSAWDAAANGSYGEAAAFAKKARANAEDAFFQPTIMALRYLPLEHHLAVYTPLFVPMIIHILVAFLKEVPRWRRIDQKE
ncbi:hypothetical protein CBR_g46590 [Chara braunii]|uniref:GPI transamidase component PIG-S n=1 Tax=Chara braunii TaxID=69332 RepID=A0A388M0P0_CHABU|nr:hypothetical protein CBR_g46590 [Chara braunii]|eukprot:GBG88101.1 hypothetical protein CBR_g46590 [Chara braunii]